MNQHLTLDTVIQNGMSQGLTDFTEMIASKAQQWGENFATTIQRVQLARELGKDIRTVNRYLAQLDTAGLITIESKRGRNGGTVIMFNKERLRFEPKENPITSDTKEAREIRERVFPTAPKKIPKKRYRSKAQIAEERALRSAIQTENDRLNDIVESTYNITRDFFDNFDDPELYFKGYLCAQMYNAYAVVFPKNRYEFYKDSDPRRAESALKAFNKANSYNVMPDRFVGTHQYATFIELARYCAENEINPLSYLTVQFEYAEWLALAGKARVGAIPYLNTLLCEQAKYRYANRTEFYKEMRREYGLFQLTPEKVGYIGARYPIVSGLLYAFRYGKRTREALDPLLEEPLQSLVPSPKTVALFGFYSQALQAIKDSSLSVEQATELKNYLKEQVALFSARHTLNAEQYVMAFPLQIHVTRCTAVYQKNLNEEDYFSFIGNMSRVTTATDKEFEGFKRKGESIDFSFRANRTFEPTLRLLADYRGLGVDLNLVRSAVQELGEDIIPIDNFGMLDIFRLYDTVIDKETLKAVEEQEEENLAYCKYA